MLSAGARVIKRPGMQSNQSYHYKSCKKIVTHNLKED